MINRNNYEAYLLDYLEKSISPQDELLLLEFLDNNPDLKSDLEADVSLSLSNETLPKYGFKDALRKHPSLEYDLSKIDYLLIKKQEEGLQKEEAAELVLLEPNEEELNKESSAYASSRLKRDKSIRFAEKLKLKRWVLNSRIDLRTINRIASIAVVVFLSTVIWFTQDKVADNSGAILSEKVDNFIEQPSQLASANPKVLNKKKVFQRPVSKDSLMKIANDPMGKKERKASTNKKVIKIENRTEHMPKMLALSGVTINTHKEINAYEHGLNVMIPQYMSNNILRRELAAIYGQLEKEGTDSPKMMAFLEGGVKVLNFLSSGSVGMDKYYDKDGNIVGYRVAGSALEVQHKAR